MEKFFFIFQTIVFIFYWLISCMEIIKKIQNFISISQNYTSYAKKSQGMEENTICSD